MKDASKKIVPKSNILKWHLSTFQICFLTSAKLEALQINSLFSSFYFKGKKKSWARVKYIKYM